MPIYSLCEGDSARWSSKCPVIPQSPSFRTGTWPPMSHQELNRHLMSDSIAFTTWPQFSLFFNTNQQPSHHATVSACFEPSHNLHQCHVGISTHYLTYSCKRSLRQRRPQLCKSLRCVDSMAGGRRIEQVRSEIAFPLLSVPFSARQRFFGAF